MRVLIKMKIGAIVLILLSQCAILEIQNSNSAGEKVLASKEAECQAITKRHWSFLYGTVPISFLNTNPEELFDGKMIRYKEKAGVVDFIISIVGGFSMSITSKTIVIENCDAGGSKPQVETKTETE